MTAAKVRFIEPADRPALLALNNEHAVELSWLTAERLGHMLDAAFRATAIGDLDAALIAFDQDSRYDGLHFAWFRARYPRFVYVDRVMVAAGARRRGLAGLFYADLFSAAAAAGHDLVACEVNYQPPNPASQSFHEFPRLRRGRTVAITRRQQSRRLPGATLPVLTLPVLTMPVLWRCALRQPDVAPCPALCLTPRSARGD